MKSRTRRPRRKVVLIAAACLAGTGTVAAFVTSYCLVGDPEARPKMSNLSAFVSEAESPADARKTSLKAMTLNIAHGRKRGPNQLLQRSAAIRSNLDDIAAMLRREEPDMVALQEADGPSFWSGGFNHVQHLAEGAKFSHWTRGEHAKAMRLSYGTALLSMLPLRDPVSVTFAPSPPTPSKGFVVCAIDWPGGSGIEVDVASVHLDFSSKSVRRKQAEEMIGRLSRRRRPLILMGDFNCEWTAKEPTLRAIAGGLYLRAYRPESADMDTFPPGRRRLDWILVSRELEFSSYKVLPDAVSDHLGVVSELRMANKTN